MKVGLFGGAFNPVTNAHIALARSAIDNCNLDRVIFIPTGKPVDVKKRELVSSVYHRLNMLDYALSKYDDMFYNSYEMFFNNRVSYSIYTIKDYVDNNLKDEVYLIVGSDIDIHLKGWKDREEILVYVSVLKAGVDFPFPEMDIRSSLVRQLVSMNESIESLVDEDVEWYIKNNGLYGRIE